MELGPGRGALGRKPAGCRLKEKTRLREIRLVPGNIVPGNVVPTRLIPGNIVPSDIVPGNIVPLEVVPRRVNPREIEPRKAVVVGAKIRNRFPGKWLPIDNRIECAGERIGLANTRIRI